MVTRIYLAGVATGLIIAAVTLMLVTRFESLEHRVDILELLHTAPSQQYAVPQGGKGTIGRPDQEAL
jgi:hypothetical protein